MILYFCESRMCTRSQCPKYKLQGISWVCFILYFSKQAGNTTRRVCEVAYIWTNRRSGFISMMLQELVRQQLRNLISMQRIVFCSDPVCQETFSLLLSAHFIFCYFPQSQNYEGKNLFRNRQEIVELWTPFFVVKCHYIRFLLLVHKYVHISVQFFFLAPEIISALKTQDLLLVITLENCW